MTSDIFDNFCFDKVTELKCQLVDSFLNFPVQEPHNLFSNTTLKAICCFHKLPKEKL